jgi:flagella basal body P-ring formation protein FlgA
MICKLSQYTLTAAGLMYAVSAAAGEQNTPQHIPTVTRTIQAGELIGENDLELRNMTGRGLPSGTVLSEEDLVGREAMRTLYPGNPVIHRNVRIPPLARKGATVAVVYNARGLHLVTDGKLLEDGSAGDTVRLMTELSSRVLVGTVLQDGTIQVR